MSIQSLADSTALVIKQRKELVEILGYESRNKYEIFSNDTSIMFAAEQQKGLLGMMLRQFLGHWRNFEIHLFDQNKQKIASAKHPFRFYFNELILSDNQGVEIGRMRKRFSILSKKFILTLPSGENYTMHSPFWKIWTFPISHRGQDIAIIKKKWSGALKEIFLDADNFLIEFGNTSLSNEAKATILAAGLFVDLLYFEKKAR